MPTLMFCVGATKAGTSWLYDYLQGHPDVRLPVVKELHYFDSLDLDSRGFTRRDLGSALASLRAERVGLTGARAAEMDAQIADVETLLSLVDEKREDMAAYLGLLFRDAGDRKLVGEITPAYGLLSEDRLRQMAGLTGDVRFIFVMRDPLDRLWSHVRMNAARQLQPGEDLEQKARNLLNKAVKHGQADDIVRRGDYAGIVARLKAAVPAEKLHLEFYEDMLTPAGVSALCRFLGIADHPADFGKRVHGGKAAEMRPGQRRAALDFLAPQYAYVSETIGALPDRWQAQMAEA